MKISVKTQSTIVEYILNPAYELSKVGKAIKEDFIKDFENPMFNQTWIYDNTRIFIGRDRSNPFKLNIIIQSQVGVTLEASFRISETQIIDKYRAIYKLDMTSENDSNSSYFMKTEDNCLPISDEEANNYKQMYAKQKSGKSNLTDTIEKLYESLNPGESIIITKQ